MLLAITKGIFCIGLLTLAGAAGVVLAKIEEKAYREQLSKEEKRNGRSER